MPNSVTNDAVAVKVTLRHSNNHSSIDVYAQDAANGLSKFYPGPMSCHVILDHQKNDYEQNKLAEVTLHVPQRDFVASESGASYEKAIDNCIESLSRQLKKYKEKQRNI
jgi:putative sigma-54 modulation protein